MGDPRFRHAVILIVRHDKEGALGIVINRPVEERPLASLLEAMGEADSAAQGNGRIFWGGPVRPTAAFIRHSPDYRDRETIEIDGRLAVTSSRAIPHEMGHG